MKTLGFSGAAVSVSAVAVILAACNGSQPQIAPPGAARVQSWIAPGAISQNLLYIGDASSGGVLVYTYLPNPRFLGILTVPSQPGGECVDAAQNVFVTDEGPGSRVTYEYAHGGRSPIAILGDPNGTPSSCSIDPTTGDLAVTSIHNTGGYGELAIYKAAKGRPKMYSGLFRDLLFCGYDNIGNLYVDGLDLSSNFLMAELPKSGKTLRVVTLNQQILFPAGVQWDGAYVAVGDNRYSLIYQFTVSGYSGTKVSSTRLRGSPNLNQFFILGGMVVDPAYGQSQGLVGIYKYPAGGKPVKTITGVSSPYSAVVSLALK